MLSDATPDHWHSQQTIEAISPQDVYVENRRPTDCAHQRDVEAYKKGKQGPVAPSSAAGTLREPRRSSTAARGNVTHVTIVQPDPARSKEAKAVPPGLTGPVAGTGPKKPFKPSRLGFRAGTTTAAAWSPTGARITSTWRTGS